MLAELSRELGRILSLSRPSPTPEQRATILDAAIKVGSWDDLPESIVDLLESLKAGKSQYYPSENRANPYHDKAGKFAKANSHGGIDWNSSDGKKLNTITKKWQGQSGQVEAIQRDFMKRAAGKRTASKQRDEHMRVLKDGIKNSPTNDQVLYRGVKLPKDYDVGATVGTSFIIPPSSFTSDRKIAKHFVDRKQQASTTVTYRVAQGKARGLKIPPDKGDTNYSYEKETISAGQFKVLSAEKLPGNQGWLVDIEHTAMFDWED